MNVLYIDITGTLCTYHNTSDEDIEEKIKILGKICHELNLKIVIASGAKEALDEKTMKPKTKEMAKILELFIKYGIDCIGRTPTVPKRINNNTYYSAWKEDEIRLHLYYHPEIERFCVADDHDLKTINHLTITDLDKLKDHLVTMLYYGENKEQEGILEEHSKQIAKILQKDNKYRHWRKDGTRKI